MWVVAAVGVVLLGAVVTSLWALAPTLEFSPLLGHTTVVALLRTTVAVAAGFAALLLIRRANLTGESAPRLIGVSFVLLAIVVVVSELPTVLGGSPSGVLLALRVAGLVAAMGMLVATIHWPSVDARLRSRDIAAGGAVVAGATVILLAATMAAVPLGSARVGVAILVLVGALVLTRCLVRKAREERRRLFAAAALMILAWSVAQIPLFVAVEGFAGGAVAFELLRVLAVLVALQVAFDDLEEAFVTQRGVLLRTEQDRRSVEQQLVDRQRRAEERAHEARSALTAIEGASGLLSRYHAGLDDDGRVALSGAIRAEIERLQRLVDDGQSEHEPEELHVAAVVSAEADFARQAGGRVEVDVPAQLRAFAERDAVHGILRNLLVNARTHAPEATVTISGHDTDEGTLELRVDDDGPGIPSGEHERIFERGHRGGNGDRPGSGLGLHVARELAQRSRGVLWADDAPGGGAAFVLRLPRASEAGAQRQATKPLDQLRQISEGRRLGVA